MKLLVIFLSVFLFALSASSQRRPGLPRYYQELPVPERKSTRVIEDKWITQRLDHFNIQNTNTFEMRYFANDEHYQPGGPFFIFIGGEYAAQAGWVQGGHIFDMAREMNGYIFHTEHRYYGLSRPVPNTETDNLRYMGVDQALADLAYFIASMRVLIPGATNSGVILVGGSYPGSMAVWFRQRYPELSNGVWSSSAPLLAEKDFGGYMEIVGWVMGHLGGQTCYDRLEEAFAQIEAYVASGQTDRLQTLFNICAGFDFNNQLDVWSLFDRLTNQLSWLVQYATPSTIEEACASITDPGIPDPLEAFANWAMADAEWCFNGAYQSWIDFLLDTDFKPLTEFDWRVWIYQTCNEFGWYQTSGSDNQPFGSSFPVDLYAQWCADTFDNIFNSDNIKQNVINTNSNHGGLSPNVTNVFSTHGELDPYRAAGVQTDINPSSPTVILEGLAHCADLYSISDSDTDQLRETKERITASVRQWLGLS